MKIARDEALAETNRLLRSFPVVMILGARQVGKTRLASDLAAARRPPVHRFDLERPEDLARLQDPILALEGLRGLVILDEVQRAPAVIPVLRVLADRPRAPARFLLLGSAAPSLLHHDSESLAGRIGFLQLGGFGLHEVGPERLERLWLRGGLPRAFLATFLERDVPQLGISLPSATLRRLWSMVAHCHAQVWNSSRIGASLGVADTTVRRYLDALIGTFVVRQLLPWSENLSKRQVKTPKVFVADTGLLHTLLGIETRAELDGHPSLGASWEGFLVDQVARRLGARPEECFFWGTHAGAELDLLVVRGRRRLGFEIKRTSAPAITRSMQVARSDLRLERIDLIHGGRDTFPLAEGLRAVSASRILADLAPL